MVIIDDMAGTAVDNTNFAITISLTSKQKKQLEKALGSLDANSLSGLATGLVHDLAGGGMMVDPAVMSRLQDSAGEINDPKELIALVDGGSKRTAGKKVYSWTIDPIYEQALEEVARMQGVSPEEMIQRDLQYCIEQGWIWEINVEGFRVNFTNEQMERIAKLIGLERHEVSGTDIYEYVQNLIKFSEVTNSEVTK